MLTGKQIILRHLQLEDISLDYINWMNDYTIVKYTESRFTVHTKDSITAFVSNCNNRQNRTFAIIVKDSGIHIGNIKVGNINWVHRCGDIGLIIGKPEYHGRGIATEAISLVSEYSFQHLGLHRITAGAYILNKGSIRAFEKNGFQQYGKCTNAYYLGGGYVDGVLMEKINPYEFPNKKS